jgi:adenylate kinase family enzyme
LPVLTVIAGPNGAGKSTHSKELLSDFGIEAFDFDKEFYSIWSEFNFDPYIKQGALERTQKLYVDRRFSALNKTKTSRLKQASILKIFSRSWKHLDPGTTILN